MKKNQQTTQKNIKHLILFYDIIIEVYNSGV